MIFRKRIVKKENILALAVSFIFPMIIMMVAFGLRGIYPGGPITILSMDMQAQYMPFYASLRYIGNSDSSLFVSLSGALAYNYFGVFAYYLTSPLVWLTSLFELSLLPDLIYFITILKIGACGFSFCWFLLYLNGKRRWLSFLFSCCYALMSYNIAYSINIMWLDGIMLLPWILYGIECYLDEKKGRILIVSTTLSMLLCYYISFMSATFSLFYLLIRLIEKKRFDCKTILGCVSRAFIGVGLSMPLVLPGLLSMRYGKLSEKLVADNVVLQYSPINVLKQFLAGSYDTVYNDGLPFLFCGTLTLIMAIFFFLSSGETKVSKLLYGALLLFYFISMCFFPLDRALHGFHDTACFEVRYSYVICCEVLILAYRGANDLLEGKVYERSRVTMIILGTSVFVILELILNTATIISELMVELHYRPRSEYESVLRAKTALIDEVNDNSFYRISDNNGYTHNDGAWLGYNGFGFFSSIYNFEVMNYLGDLGEKQLYHDLEDGDRTLLEESLFGAKYRIVYPVNGYSEDIITKYGLYGLLRNEDALELGYMIAYEPGDEVTRISSNPFDNQNSLAGELSGIHDTRIYIEFPLKDLIDPKHKESIQSISLEIPTMDKQPFYMYLEDKTIENRKKSFEEREKDDGTDRKAKLLINGSDYSEYVNVKGDRLIYLGEYSGEDTLRVDAESMELLEGMHVAYMDVGAYKRVIQKLGTSQMVVSQHKNGRFRGNINALEDGYMLLTLPYMDGWRIKVDGENTSYESYRNVMIILPLSKGEHTIDIQYIAPGTVTGVIAGTLSLLLAVLFFEIKKRGTQLNG